MEASFPDDPRGGRNLRGFLDGALLPVAGGEPMSYPSTFASGPYRLLAISHCVTEWDTLLRALELTQEQAYWLIKKQRSSGSTALRLRLWIERNYRRRYIPSEFLTAEQMESFTWE